MKWLGKKRNAVIRKWMNNEISLMDAANELCRLGVNIHKAYALLEKM